MHDEMGIVQSTVQEASVFSTRESECFEEGNKRNLIINEDEGKSIYLLEFTFLYISITSSQKIPIAKNTQDEKKNRWIRTTSKLRISFLQLAHLSPNASSQIA